jgi:hypothetical protein
MPRPFLVFLVISFLAAAGALPAAAQTENPKFTHTTEDEREALLKLEKVEWKASAQGGLLMTTGNSRITTFSAGLNASRKANRNRFALEANAAYARSSIFLAVDQNANGTVEPGEISRPAQTTTRSWLVKGRYDRFITEHNSLYLIAAASADRPAGKELVGSGQAGYSRQLYKDEIHLMVAEIGYDYTHEDRVAGEALSIHSIRGFAGYSGKLSSDTGLEASVEALFNMNELDAPAGKVEVFEDNRVNSKLSITTKMIENVSFRFGFEALFDNAPAPRPPFALPYADGFVPLADELDTKTEATLIVNFL